MAIYLSCFNASTENDNKSSSHVRERAIGELTPLWGCQLVMSYLADWHPKNININFKKLIMFAAMTYGYVPHSFLFVIYLLH